MLRSQLGERQQIERDNIILAEEGLQHVLGLDLRIRVGKAHLDAGFIKEDRLKRQFFLLQQIFHLPQQRCVYFGTAFAGSDLHCRRLAENIG